MRDYDKGRLWFNAQDNVLGGPINGYVKSQQLAKALGLPYPKPAYWHKYDYTPEFIATLKRLAGPEGPELWRLLTGPYGQTIIKVWEIQRAESVV